MATTSANSMTETTTLSESNPLGGLIASELSVSGAARAGAPWYWFYFYFYAPLPGARSQATRTR
jgi:hypothetical protein